MEKVNNKEGIWRTQDVLLAIPKIQNILQVVTGKKSWNRSSSETLGVLHGTFSHTPKGRKHKIKQQDFFFTKFYNKTQRNTDRKTESKQVNTSLNFYEKGDQNLQTENKNARNDKRKQICIPIIKLEKSLPKNYRVRSLVLMNPPENYAPPEPKKKNSGCCVLDVSFPQTTPVKRKIPSRSNGKKILSSTMRDESVGIENLNSQSSGLFSDNALFSHFVPMFYAEGS